MKKAKQLIISKQRYIGNVQNDFVEYIRQTADRYEWVKDPGEATRFSDVKKALNFLNDIRLDGATIEPEPKPKLFKAQFIEIGRSRVNKDFFFNTKQELHKEIGKYIASKGWGLEETEVADRWEIQSGFRTAGTIIITEVKPIENEKEVKG